MLTWPHFLMRLAAATLLAVAVLVLASRPARAQSLDPARDAASQPAEAVDESAEPNTGPAAKPDAGQASEPDETDVSKPAPDISRPGKDVTTAPPGEPAAGTEGEATGQRQKATSEFGPDLHAAVKDYHDLKGTGDPVFDRASGSFPAFCRDWHRRLHDRELNNLENVSWKDENGWKTGTYVSYSPIKTCACKRSTGGVPIGELTYQETEVYIIGRTVEEARHAEPKPVTITNTTEIFRWDKTKWDDGR